MRVASFLGRKGGVGKTTNAHATAHGLNMVGIVGVVRSEEQSIDLPQAPPDGVIAESSPNRTLSRIEELSARIT